MKSSITAANTKVRPSFATVVNSTSKPSGVQVDLQNLVKQKFATGDGNYDGTSSSILQTNSQRKFNVLVFGIKENDKGTPRHVRNQDVLTNVGNVLSTLDPLVSVTSICDCFRLGKFCDGKTRPVLVKLTRSADVVSILSNRHKLVSLRGIYIKPDLNPQDRKVESLLLKERWSLIQNGVARSNIKIKGNCIFVDNKKHGLIRDDEFHQMKPKDTIIQEGHDSTHVFPSASCSIQCNSTSESPSPSLDALHSSEVVLDSSIPPINRSLADITADSDSGSPSQHAQSSSTGPQASTACS